jgi:hypothetical protein
MLFYTCLRNLLNLLVQIANKTGLKKQYILCHTVPLLGDDREISNYTTAIAMQRIWNRNRGIAFSYCPFRNVSKLYTLFTQFAECTSRDCK